MATQILGKEGINYVRSTNPAYRLREVDQTAPAGMWQMDASSGDLLFQCATAADWSAFTTVVTMTSTPSITIHGTITFSGTIVFSANVRLDDDIVILFGDDSDYYMGYSATADVLEIGTGSTINSNVAMAIDSSGNVGIGISSLESWDANYVAVQLGGGGSWMSTSAGAAGTNEFLNNNAYWDGVGWKYQHTDEANQLWMRDGKFSVRSAASGSADAAITWVDGLTQTVDGDVGIGNSDPSAPLEVTGAIYAGRSAASQSGSVNLFNDSGATIQLKRTDSNVETDERIGRLQYTTRDGAVTYAGEFNLKAAVTAVTADAQTYFQMKTIPQDVNGTDTANQEQIFKFYANDNDTTLSGTAGIWYPVMVLNNSKDGATWGTADVVGSIEFQTEDTGTSYPTVSAIRSISDDDGVGTPAGSLGFYTAQAAGEIAERMFISRLGTVLVNGGVLQLNETANTKMQINPTNTQSVPTGAGNEVIIASFSNAGGGGGLVVVVGAQANDGGVQFVDLVLLGSNGHAVIQSLDTRGSPAARTYSNTANTDLELYMAGSEAFDVQTMNIMGANPN
jgi:hypothetical protein